MKARAESAINFVLAVAAIAIAITYVRRDSNTPEHGAIDEPSLVSDWRDMLSDGITFGRHDSRLHVVEFADLECPACSEWHRNVLRPLLDEEHGSVSYTMMHLPLPRHRFARLSATAMECATEQKRGFEFLNEIYERQDSIGLRPWWGYARRAGVPDSLRFEQCFSTQQFPRIDAGLTWADELSVAGTPTILVNGWLLARPPDTETLKRVIREVESGRVLDKSSF